MIAVLTVVCLLTSYSFTERQPTQSSSIQPIEQRKLAIMTRATRFAAYLAPLVIYYLLALLGIVNIPFTSQEASDALVPVVSLSASP
jgi:hypothetical protein